MLWRRLVRVRWFAPFEPLLRRQRTPLAYEALALRRRQALEMLERGMQLFALLARQLVELAHVGARLPSLIGRHLLPAGDALADFRTFFRRQRGPVFGAMEHVRPFAGRQGIPLMLQRCQHVTLGGGKTAPGWWRGGVL